VPVANQIRPARDLIPFSATQRQKRREALSFIQCSIDWYIPGTMKHL
jgi:hypothetical protein